MPSPFSFPLVEAPSTPSAEDTSSSVVISLPTSRRPFLGNGLLRPFRRDQKSDFANGSDEANVRSCIEQVLGTECDTENGDGAGELPWNTEFGSVLYRLRHRNNDLTLRQLAQVFIVQALRRWEPRVFMKAIEYVQKKTDQNNKGGPDTLFIRIRYDIINANVAGNNVVVPDVVQDVRV